MKVKLIITFVVMAIVSGVSIILADRFLNSRLEQKYEEVIQENIIVTPAPQREYQETKDTTQDVIVPDIDLLGQDQEIQEVYGDINVLSMPTVNIRSYIYDNTNYDSLLYGCGRYKTTKRIGEKGICAVAGHSSDTWRCIFNNVKNINFMDEFYVFDSTGLRHTYYVTGKYVVNPDSTYELYTDDETYSIFKLITCCNGGAQRLIVEGTELNAKDIQAYIDELHRLKQGKILTTMLHENVSILKQYTYDEKHKIYGKWYYIPQTIDRIGFIDTNIKREYQHLIDTER